MQALPRPAVQCTWMRWTSTTPPWQQPCSLAEAEKLFMLDIDHRNDSQGVAWNCNRLRTIITTNLRIT